MNKECATCQYYNQRGESAGECRRFPPASAYREPDGEAGPGGTLCITTWPVVQDGMWCGAWTPGVRAKTGWRRTAELGQVAMMTAALFLGSAWLMGNWAGTFAYWANRGCGTWEKVDMDWGKFWAPR